MRVAQVSVGVEDFRRSARRHGHAAEGTAAATGMSDLADHWTAVLPQFGGAGDRLADVLRSAAGEYVGVDDRVAQAAGGGA